MRFIRQLLPFAGLMLVILVLTARDLNLHFHNETFQFLTTDNFLNIFRRCSVNAIIAVGMTAIIISGGVDLSVGTMMAVAGMMGAWTMLQVGAGELTATAMWIGTFVGIITGFICGLFNGLLINGLKLPPFIATLGTMGIFRGVAYVMNSGQPYNVSGYKYLGNGQFLSVPVSIVIAGIIAVIAALVLRHTRLGRYTYAIGNNRNATLFSGINVKRQLTIVYALTGLLVGVAAMIQTSRTISAQPTAGAGLELDIIAAVVIGGASLSGGTGTIFGTIMGTLLISFLRNGCTLLGIDTNVQYIVIGAIIIIAVAVDQLARGKTK